MANVSITCRQSICCKCGREVLVNFGGFIGRAELEGRPDMLFVVYCQSCGENYNAMAKERGAAGLTPLAEVQRPLRPYRRRTRTRNANG
jgi:hypothetical protein